MQQVGDSLQSSKPENVDMMHSAGHNDTMPFAFDAGHDAVIGPTHVQFG